MLIERPRRGSRGRPGGYDVTDADAPVALDAATPHGMLGDSDEDASRKRLPDELWKYVPLDEMKVKDM